ncbi:Rv1355c family protein [Chitinophaga japonensis]|uniref:ThiF family protein n=1 Tax=Chitinophaga japonensis TaxID=104662 RepID=A0A562TFM9_CHIJA|nr:Rv1355c family protein [Chitinophaga japonensis]TWI92349.1 ThiF family protein [Chitinophaga japonensis]
MNLIDEKYLTASKDQDQRAVLFFRLQHPPQQEALRELLHTHPHIRVHDTIRQQLKELIKTRHPAEKLSEEQLQQKITAHAGAGSLDAYGVWVYYPWSQRLVHLLDEAEFVEMRTSRNQHKITAEEIQRLATKKIGIIGLSVGQSAALTLAMERVCGELRIADFDTLDLSNLNRLRAGVHNIGLPKTTIVAREIAELDPFLKVTCFDEGITESNIASFLTGNGRLDVLVEECDSLDIKILSRQQARAARMPVIMETSDRGMMDIERFDQEPDRPILHGKVQETLSYSSIRQFSGEERMRLVYDILDYDNISDKLKHSIGEIGRSITTWPQLASAVALGGAMVAHVCREICLDRPMPSGRYYVDPDQVF